ADGLALLPGMVDGHAHFQDPGDTPREDFRTGSAAAAAGGVTTVIEHTHSQPVRDLAALREKVAYLRGRSLIDFGLAAHAWPDRIVEVAPLWAAGVTFFKVFTCTTHGVPGFDHALHSRPARSTCTCARTNSARTVRSANSRLRHASALTPMRTRCGVASPRGRSRTSPATTRRRREHRRRRARSGRRTSDCPASRR